MCVLSHVDIQLELEAGNLVIDPFDPELLRPNSYDWTLGGTIFVADKKKLNTWNPVLIEPGKLFTFKPGQFYLCSTLERFVLPKNIMATMTGRSSVGRLGVIEHLTAAHVDAGFSGHLTAEVKVLGPWGVPLMVGQNVGQMIFEYLRTEAELGYADLAGSKYVNQGRSPQPSRLAWEGAEFPARNNVRIHGGQA